MAIQKDTGIVLRVFDIRRSSKIASIYTRRFGKISGLFKGFYTHPDYFITSLDCFTVNELVFYERPNELWLVSAAYLRKDFSFSQDLDKYFTASNIAEFVDKNLALHKPQEEIYNLLYQSLSALQQTPSHRILFAFKVKILRCLGISPVLNQCSVCKKDLVGAYFFSLKSGGVVCDKCAGGGDNTIMKISSQTLKIIEFIKTKPFAECLRLNISPGTQKDLFALLDKFTEYHLGTKIKSNTLLPYA